MEQMPMWCPPTPPHQDTDMYIDHTMSFLYDMNVMTESQLPPVYVKKEAVKRSRHDAGLIDNRRAIKIARKEDAVYAPRSIFERPSPALMKMRRDLKLQKYRGIVRPPIPPMPGMKMAVSKPLQDPPCFHSWTVHEDMALLIAIQNYQQLQLNLMIVLAGHIPNWDFVSDFVNTVSITYRSPKQCRHRYESVLIPREEGKQVFDTSPRKKKNKTQVFNKFTMQPKTNRPMRTSQMYTQDNNSNFSQIMNQRFDSLKGLTNKRLTAAKQVVTTQLNKNPKHSSVLHECGIDLDHPLLPVVVAARRAERIAREKKSLSSDQHLTQRLQLIKSGALQTPGQSSSGTSTSGANASAAPVVAAVVTQASAAQTTSVVTSVTTTVATTPSTPPNALRTQRIVASPLQNPTVVSVSGLSPAQLQAATQRLIVSPGPSKTIVGGTATVAGKTISQAQLQMLKQATLKQQQFRLQAGGIAGQTVKTTTVSIAGQTAVQVQFTQAQATRTQYVKQATVTGKQGITRTVTESEMAQLLKRQQQLQQQKALAAAAAGGSTQTTTIQNLSPQVFAQAIQQAGTSGTQVATLVKTVSSSGVTQTVTIPVTGVTLGTAVKALTPGIKATTPQQLQQLRLQQQLLAQKKLSQKIAGIAQVTGKGGVATQLIVGSKPLSTAMTIQQLQQVVRSPLAVPQGPVVLAKGPPRVIPVNTGQGNKPTIQVVSATSQGITTTIRPQVTSTLQGALAGLKVQGAPGTQAQQAILSQVSAAFQSQNVGVRQNSPVRFQTASGTPLVAVSVQSGSTMQQGASPQPSSTERSNDQVSRFFKK